MPTPASGSVPPVRTERPRGVRSTLRSAVHMVGATRDFWTSDLNRAAIDLLHPQPGLVVLDLGAGFGPATIEAAVRVTPGGRVIAVDPSGVMRGVLRLRRLVQQARPAIDVRDGAAERLPVVAATIDAVWAVNATHHFDDLERAAAELARVLKPGGRVLLIEEDATFAEHPDRGTVGDGHGPIPVDPVRMTELLALEGLEDGSADHQVVGGVRATVITATKPAAPSEAQVDLGQGRGPS